MEATVVPAGGQTIGRAGRAARRHASAPREISPGAAGYSVASVTACIRFPCGVDQRRDSRGNESCHAAWVELDQTIGGRVKIKDIMTAQPTTCAPDTNLATAAELMLDADCGILPVTENGKLIGVVTDRDMFIA